MRGCLLLPPAHSPQECICRNPRPQELQLSRAEPATLEALAAASHLISLTTLQVRECSRVGALWRGTAEAPERSVWLPQLHELRMEACSLDWDNGLGFLALGPLSALARLSLPRCRLSDGALPVLAAADFPGLTALELDGNFFTCHALGLALSGARWAAGLRRLSLASCRDVRGSPEFLDFLAKKDLQLGDLDLSSTDVDNGILSALRAAPWAHQLTHLSLGHCARLGAGRPRGGGAPTCYAAWADLAAAPLTSLRALDVSPGPGAAALPAAAAAHLASAPWLARLETLDAPGWRLDGLRSLARAGSSKTTRVSTCARATAES